MKEIGGRVYASLRQDTSDMEECWFEFGGLSETAGRGSGHSKRRVDKVNF